MGCQQLLDLLRNEENKGVQVEGQIDLLAAHIIACPLCSQGIDRLSGELFTVGLLTCDTCRLRLPAYYEATHSPCHSGTLSHKEITEVAIHLGQCDNCSEEYQVLAELWDMEEDM